MIEIANDERVERHKYLVMFDDPGSGQPCPLYFDDDGELPLPVPEGLEDEDES